MLLKAVYGLEDCEHLVLFGYSKQGIYFINKTHFQ